MTPRLVSVQTGPVAPLGEDGVASGILKTSRLGGVTVDPLGLDGDEHADLEAHGGPEKAVYAYAAAHYPRWVARFPQSFFPPGAMGENLTITGMTETDICVGDVHRIGTALLQACQPRQPCFKFDLLHGGAPVANAMLKSLQSGWYYRVLAPGILQSGDTVELHQRPNPDFPFIRLVEFVYRKQSAHEELTRMAGMEGLATQWRERAQQMLSSPMNRAATGPS
jgi:MOSC domain-containing protein YiiM